MDFYYGKKTKIDKQIYNLIKKIVEFKAQLPLYLISNNGHTKYGNEHLFFIEFILNLLSFKSIDSKIDFLLFLRNFELKCLKKKLNPK